MPDQHEPKAKLANPAPLAPEGFYSWELTTDSITYSECPPPIKSLILKGTLARGHVRQKSLEKIECNAEITYNNGNIKITAKDPLTHVTTVYGTSAGAIVAALFVAIPHTPNIHKKTIHAFDMSAIADSWPKAMDKTIALGIKSRHLLFAIPYLIAKPLRLVATGLHLVANVLIPKSTKWKAILFPLTMIGVIFEIIARIIGGTSLLFDPDMWCEIYNYFINDCIYRGEKIKIALKQAITINTKNALTHFLTTIKDAKNKIPALKQWEAIGLITINDARCTTWSVTNNITFRHFDFLATQFPTSGFKKLAISGTRCKDGVSVLFNFEDFPDMPIYEAVRISIALPGVYKPVIHDGVAYMDGNCANNFPIFDAATNDDKESLDWHAYYNEQAVIGADVEYNNEKQRLILGPTPITSPRGIIISLWNWLSGKDIYTSTVKTDESEEDSIDEDETQSSDDNLAFTASKLKLLAALKSANPDVSESLSTFRGDQLRTESYHKNNNTPLETIEDTIPPGLLVKLFTDLNNPKMTNEILFKSHQDKSNLEDIRRNMRNNARNALLKKLHDKSIPKQRFFPNDSFDDNTLNRKCNELIQKLELGGDLPHEETKPSTDKTEPHLPDPQTP